MYRPIFSSKSRLSSFLRHLLVPILVFSSIGVMPLPASASEVLNNGKFRFGGDGESAVTAKGFLKQASYFSSTANAWRILTHPGTEPDLSLAFGYGSGNVLGNWTQNDYVDFIDRASSPTIASGPSTTTNVVNGIGTLTITTGYTLLGGKTIEVRHEVTLEPGKSFVKIITSIRNTSGTTLQNFNFWVGTADDYVGGSDSVTKTRGNISGRSFTAISNTSDRANSVEVTNGTESVYFYSSNESVNSVVKEGCCNWQALLNVNPTSASNPTTSISTDGQYAFHFGAGDLASNSSTSLTWFWIAGELGEISAILADVAAAETEVDSTPALRAPRIPSFDQFASGPAFVRPGESLVLTGSSLFCTTYVQINSQPTTFSFGTLPDGLSSLTIAIPSGLKPGPHSMSMDSCGGPVTFDGLLIVPKDPAVFEGVSRNGLERMLLLARLQTFVLVNRLDYNHAHCLVNASVPSLQTAAKAMLRDTCKIATSLLSGAKGSTSELKNTHKPANLWIRITLSNK